MSYLLMLIGGTVLAVMVFRGIMASFTSKKEEKENDEQSNG